MVSSIKAWVGLQSHAEEMQAIHLKNLFHPSEDRFGAFSFSFDHYLLDLSKQRITGETLGKLLLLADQQGLEAWINKLFNGEKVNDSEQRAALHTALRLPEGASLRVDELDVAQGVQDSLFKMHGLVERIQQAQWRGFDGSPIRSVVNIGVGGSNLGPLMACTALDQYMGADIRHLDVHFVSSMDGSELEVLLPNLDPATTLFIVASKSFATVDTLANANTARQWLLSASQQSIDLINQHHFIAVTSRPDQALTWGVPEKNQLLLWDWVGGRYSLWSVVGLPIALKIGMQNFREMLAGAHGMDEHFRGTPFEKNLPVLLALVSVWNINFLNIHAHAILPYDGRLSQLPAYLEQLEMESNGKSINRQGERIEYRTCPVLWGQVGSSAQHAFYQLLHQGTEPVMCDFIASAMRYESEDQQLKQQHQLSLANCLAQSRLLAIGESVSNSEEQKSNYKHYDGNQPSTTIMLDTLTPETFGGLIAMYEHKVFVQSVIWDINPFDQWGVEGGKHIANSLATPFNEADDRGLDSSTNGLLNYVSEMEQRGQGED